MGDILTNNGMVANSEEMRKFITYLNTLMDNLRASMDMALKSIQQIRDTGYKDHTFEVFEATFNEEVKFINALNDKLKESSDHYNKLAELVEKHNKHNYQSKYGGQFNIY
jgi:methyl-accepting chemotaxis protein